MSLWEDYANVAVAQFPRQTLVYAVFGVDKRFDQHHQRWLRYPWNFQAPTLNEGIYNKQRYVYGDLVHDGCNTDQQLFVWLLQNLSEDTDWYIRVWDSEDHDVVLVLHHQHVPPLLQPSKAFNRVWLHRGAWWAIDDDMDLHLMLDEALLWLQRREPVRLDEVLNAAHRLAHDESAKVVYLDKFADTDIELPPALAAVCGEYPHMLHHALNIHLNQQLVAPKPLPELGSSSRYTCAIRRDILGRLGNPSPEALGQAVVAGLVDHECPNIPTIEEILDNFSKWGLLTRKQVAVTFNVESLPDDERDPPPREIEGLLDGMSDLEFSDDLDFGPGSEDSADHDFTDDDVVEVLPTRPKVADISFSDESDDPDYSDSGSIDVDDFVEFHAKHGLGMTDEQIAQHHNAKRDLDDYNDDSDYESD